MTRAMSGEEDMSLVRELERRNDVLDGQVRRLVRTEQRLFLAQRDLARQLARVDTLNRFAIDVAGIESPEEIVTRAAGALFSLFPLDQCVGFLAGDGGLLAPVAVRSAPGREPSLAARALETAPFRPLARPLARPPLGDVLIATACAIHAEHQDLAPLLERMEQIFDGDAAVARDSALVVMVPIARGGRAAGVLVFRHQGGPVSFHEELPTAKDVAFLGVFAQQVAAALTNARLVERERLAAIGELAAVVAHEVRNPLGAIFNSVALLARLAVGRRVEEQLLGIVRDESERLNQIVTDLIEFARPDARGPHEESLVVITEAAIESVRARYPTPPIALRLDEPLPRVRVDERRVRQALVNLLVNAVQASPDDGEVEVRVGLGTGGRVQVAVVDRGPGIPEHLGARIFEPFVTTKASGTGLGLAVVKRVAEVHGGTVEASPTSGGGATFTLSIAGMS